MTDGGPPELETPFTHLRTPSDSARSDRDDDTFVALAEIDRFSLLRGRIGYERGNAIMATLGDRISASGAGITIGRVGRSSVEFAFRARDRTDATRLLQVVGAAIERPLKIDGLEFTLSAVIGAVDLGQGHVRDSSVDLAAAAVGAAQHEHQRFRIADVSIMPAHGVDDLTLLREMSGAMCSGALQVHYQPKLRLRSNCIDAAEALIRWHHPTVGNVPIEPFVRLLEDTGAIRRLTEWVIARAVLDQATMAACGHDLMIWVNLSGLLLADPAFTTRALELMNGSEHRIGFEITETAVIGEPERAMANLAAFTAAGVKIAIDDYGSGLSSLAYLKQLPAQELKIDRMFIKDLTDSHRDPLLVRSSIDLAHALEMEVTAEGVDDPMAMALLRMMGCDLVQGYLVAPALPVTELRRLLADQGHLARLTAPRVHAEWAIAAAS